MVKKFFLVMIFLFLLPCVLAADIAMVVKDADSLSEIHEQPVKEILENEGYSLVLVDKNNEASINYSNYDLILIAGRPSNVYSYEHLDSFVADIPVNKHPTLVIDYKYINDFGWIDIVSTIYTNQKQRIYIPENDHPITSNFSGNVVVHILESKTILGLDEKETNLTSLAKLKLESNTQIIAVADPGTVLYNGETTENRIAFFGITHPLYWTVDARKLFKSSVDWAIYGGDHDNDGIKDELDNCPETYNPEQLESDLDGLGNVCDACPYDKDNDIDGDGVCGDIDNCVLISNPSQEDFDDDGKGDICDEDIDGDYIENEDDLCEFTGLGEQADENGCADYQLIVINEFESNPKKGSEWVELYNPTESDVDISNFEIWDRLSSPHLKYRVPLEITLKNNDYYIANVSGLNNNGEFLILYDSFGTIIDKTPTLTDNDNNDNTWQRSPNGADTDSINNWNFQKATKGISNDADVTPPIVNLIAPIDGHISNTDKISFNFNVSDNNASILQCRLYSNFNGKFEEIEIMNVNNNDEGQFNLTDLADGNFIWNVECFDGFNYAFASVNWSFMVNDTPYLIQDMPNQTWDEDTVKEINLTQYFKDKDNESLSYSISSLVNIDVNIVGGIASLTPDKNWFGKETAIFTACDKGKCIEDEVNLKVVNVNDAPILEHIDDIEINENNLIRIEANATDFDGDPLVYNINDTRFNQDENVFTWQTNYTDSGIYYINVSVSDGNLSASQLIKIIVNEINEPPHLTIPDLQIEEDSEFYDISLNAYDNDGEIVKYEVVSENINKVDCSITDAVLGIEPAPDWYGIGENAATCTIQVTDNEGAADRYAFKINVTNVNDPPTIDPSPLFNPIIAEDVSQEFNVVWHDIDNSEADVKVKWFVNENLSGIGNNYEFNNGTGKYNIEVIVNDSVDFVSHNWTLIVSNKPIVDSYTGGTTNFSNMTEQDLTAVNLILEKESGRIEFLESIDLRNTVDFENYADIKNSLVAIDTSYLTALKNKPARITFYGLTYSKMPTIYYNKGFTLEYDEITNICPLTVCYDRSYDSNTGTLSFYVTGFSTFKAGSILSCSVQGGYICSENETCTGIKLSAIEDRCCNIPCMENPPEFSEIDRCENLSSEVKIEIKEPDKDEEIGIGELLNVEVQIENKAEEDLDFDVAVYLYDLSEDDEIEEDDDSIDIDEDDSETIEFEFSIPKDINEDNDYAIFVKVIDKDEKFCNENYVKIDIERQEHDVIIENLEIMPSEAVCGDYIDVFVELKNEGKSDEDVYLTLENSDLNIDEKTNEFELEKYNEDDEAERSFNIKIPKNVSAGNYTIKITVVFDSKEESEERELVLGSCKKIEKKIEKIKKIYLKTEKKEVKEAKGKTAIFIISVITTVVVIVIVVYLWSRMKQKKLLG